MSEPVTNADGPQKSASNVERFLPVLQGYMKVITFFLVTAFVLASWSDLRALLPRLSSFKALGVEINMTALAGDLRKQAESVKSNGVVVDPAAFGAVLFRAARVKSVFQGATILWVDGNPANNLPFRRLLRTLGAVVEPARSTQEALDLAQTANFDLIVSNIKRDQDNGVDGLKRLRAAHVTCPAIFYVFDLDASKPMPETSIGITNRPDELLNLVIDGLERSRWSQEPSPMEAPVASDPKPSEKSAERR